MKITSDSIKSQLAANIVATRPSRGAAGTTHTAEAAGKSSVDLSPAARQLAQLHDGEHDINAVKVQELRDALAAGTLKIDTSRIADKLIASARELLK